MKKCPLCAEDIQEEAIRCKHCGGDLAVHADKLAQVEIEAEEAKTEANRKSKAAKVLAIIGAILGFMITQSVTSSVVRIVIGTALASIAFPIFWKMGGAFGRLSKPDLILTSGAVDLGIKKIAYSLMPFAFSVLGGVASLLILGGALQDRNVATTSQVSTQESQKVAPSNSTEEANAVVSDIAESTEATPTEVLPVTETDGSGLTALQDVDSSQASQSGDEGDGYIFEAVLTDERGKIVLQSKAALTSRNVAVLPSGTQVRAELKEGKWIRVKTGDGLVGYVRDRQLEFQSHLDNPQ